MADNQQQQQYTVVYFAPRAQRNCWIKSDPDAACSKPCRIALLPHDDPFMPFMYTSVAGTLTRSGPPPAHARRKYAGGSPSDRSRLAASRALIVSVGQGKKFLSSISEHRKTYSSRTAAGFHHKFTQTSAIVSPFSLGW